MKTTKKSIGHLPYSLTARLSNPSDKNSEIRVYPIAQRNETVALSQLAYHIHEHNSQFSQGTIVGILTDLVDCIKEQLCAGNFVLLDGLARIYYTYSSEGAEKAEEFTSALITKVNLRAEIDDSFEAELNNAARFLFVPSRDEQEKAKRLQKEALELALGSDTGGNSGTGDDNDLTD